VAFTEQIGASTVEEMHEMLAKDMSEEEQSSQFYEGLLASMEYPKFAK
jgi:rubrerythrin